MKAYNPVAFRPLPVTLISIVIYVALIVPLLVVHHVVPPSSDIAEANSTEAWLDLQTLTNGFHPYNSRRNDIIRDWLLLRIKTIVHPEERLDSGLSNLTDRAPVTIFSDNTANISFAFNGTNGNYPGTSVYFEGTNIIVYIRGSQDDPDNWWEHGEMPEGKGGVLVNAHYDSVSTGYGATDDGVGVVTVLQLIRYFAMHQPLKGVVALLNNGEEDDLYGARAFSQHPMSRFASTFLNLEGAGAGGRAILFRTTDTEVTRAYQDSKMPYGNVVSADAFKRGVIRSETDYSFFNSFFGMRGLDVAFFEPRARYHTDEDNTKHTSMASVHHMMSAAFATMQRLTSDESSDFDSGKTEDSRRGHGTSSNAVWFDLFGSVFAVFTMDVLFIISLVLLILGPLTMVSLGMVLWKLDKLYVFSYSSHSRRMDSNETVGLKGLRGITRWPIAFILASAAVIGLAFLMTTTNPFIMHSSPYAVLCMMISAWLVIAYICVDIANAVRPTALQRVYILLWEFAGSWAVLVAVIRLEKLGVAGGYMLVFNFGCVYLATTLALVEMFALPRKSDFADDVLRSEDQHANLEADSPLGRRPLTSAIGDIPSEEAIDDAEDIDESTSLLGNTGRTTFKRYSQPHERADASTPPPAKPISPARSTHIYGREQPWSWSLPSSLWILEILLLVPFPFVIIGQVTLLFISATHQTLADGSDALPLYLVIALLTILLFAPLGPYLHRLTYHIPTFLFFVFIGTLLYNIIAFPFSYNNRLKLSFIQRVDLDHGTNNISLTGIFPHGYPYLLDAIATIPSAAGQVPICHPSTVRRDLTECSWLGLAAHVSPANSTKPGIFPRIKHEHWLSFNATRTGNGKAHVSLSGMETRACRIQFSRPIHDFTVQGAGTDERMQKVASTGSKELRLWSRTWGRVWEVDITWSTDAKSTTDLVNNHGNHGDHDDESQSDVMEGKVVCLWSDDNETGVIPALDEVRMFAPSWVAIGKLDDGLVEGSKRFKV